MSTILPEITVASKPRDFLKLFKLDGFVDWIKNGNFSEKIVLHPYEEEDSFGSGVARSINSMVSVFSNIFWKNVFEQNIHFLILGF